MIHPGSGRAIRRHPDTDPSEARPAAPDFSRALIVGRSPINRIVISRIVEKSGLKPVAETPEAAARVLRSVFPGIVILDGGPDNKDCEGLLARLASLRDANRHGSPSIILLAMKALCENNPETPAGVDAVVAKPITTELLQPVVDRLLERARQ